MVRHWCPTFVLHSCRLTCFRGKEIALTSTTIRVPITVHDRAQRLAEAESTTLGAVIEAALDRYERIRMMEAYNEAMARLQDDPTAWADWQAEVASLEGPLAETLEEYPYEGADELGAATADRGHE
jgi:predicted transcriptional regulator